MIRWFLIVISILSLLDTCYAEVTIYNNLPKNNDYFIGRADELKNISQKFKKNNDIVLSGSAGIGKTQIAKAYAYKNIDNYDIIYWLDAERSIDKQIINLAQLINKALKKSNESLINVNDNAIKETIKSLQEKLINTDLKWLIILDNVTEFTRVGNIFDIKNKKGKGYLISTTRNNEIDKEMIDIKRFKRGESIKFLKQLEESEYTEEQLNLLAELLGDYPLALAQAFSYISSAPNIKVDNYIRLFKDRAGDIMGVEQEILDISQGSYTDNYNKTVKVTTLMLKELIKNYSEETLGFLGFLSVLNAENIPQSLIYNYFKGDEIKASKSIARLLKYSIITKKNKNPSDNNIYNMHELTQKIIRESYKEEEVRNFIRMAAKTLNNLIPIEQESHFPMIEKEYEILDQIDNITEISEKYQINNIDIFANNVTKLEYVLLERRDFDNALKIIEQLDGRFNQEQEIRKSLAYSRFLLMKSAYSAWALSNYKNSNKLAYEAEKIIKKSPNSYEAIMLYMRLAQNHEIQGDFEKALEYVDKAEKIINNNNYNAFGHEGVVTQSRTMIYLDQGKIEEAHKSVTYALKLKEKAYGTYKEINLIPTLCRKAYILAKKGDYNQVLKDIKKIRKLIKDNFKNPYSYSPHPDLIEAIVYFQKGNTDIAYKLIKSSLNTAKQVYSKGNRQMALIYRMLGEILSKKNMHKEALESFIEAEKIYDEILLNKKIEDVSILYEQIVYNGIATLNPMQCYDYRRKHTEVFGIDNKANYRIDKAIIMAQDMPYKEN